MLDYDIKLEHRELSGVGAGQFTASAFQQQTLNNIEYDPNGYVDGLAANLFNLAVGTYSVLFFAKAQGQGVWRSSIYDQTTELIFGSNANAAGGDAVGTTSIGAGFLTVSSTATDYSLQIRSTNASTAPNLRGYPVGSGQDEVYQQVMLKKLA